MKFSGIISLLLAVLLLFSMFTVVSATEAVPDVPAAVISGTHSLDAAVSYLGTGEPVENASAVFLYDMASQTLMYAQNPDAQVYPSSLVKIMTALIAVEQGELSQIVTVDEQILAEVPLDAVSAELKPGEEISLSDLIYCMMVGSANDAAAVIAKHISGSQSAFVEQMNAYAAQLGCTGTNFMNTHGLHDPQQFTTVRDQARILSAAMENEEFIQYFSAVQYTVPATNLSEERSLLTKNFLMDNSDMEIYYDSRVTGGRTGIAEDGTRCLAVTAQNDELQLICILTGAKSTVAEDGKTTVYGSFKETTALLDSVFGKYNSVQVLYEGQTLRQYTVVNGTNDVVAGSGSAVSTLLPEGISASDLDFRYDDAKQIEAPVEIGDKLSQVQVWYGNMCVAQADLLAMNTVAFMDPAGAEQDTDNDGTVVKVIFTVLLLAAGLTAVVYLVLIVIRKINMNAAKNRSKRHRADRRRSR